MAFAPRGNGNGFWLVLTLVDTQGDPSTMEFELSSADFATAVTDKDAILAAISGVSQSIVASYHLKLIEDEDAFVFPVGADNSIKARLSFQILDSVDKARRDIPSPQNAIFVAPTGPNNNVVDTTNAAVIAFAQLFQTGGEAFLSDGEISEFLLGGQRVSIAKGLR